MTEVGPKHPRIRDDRYLAFLRKRPCVVCGAPAPSEAAHIRMGSTVYGKKPTGMGQKPDDRWCLPLCVVIPGVKAGCHKNQHSMGEAAYWREKGLNPFEIAIRLYAEGGHPDAPQPKRKPRQTIAPRGFGKSKRKWPKRNVGK